MCVFYILVVRHTDLNFMTQPLHLRCYTYADTEEMLLYDIVVDLL